MNRLVLAFGIVCLLQGLSAEPRPEFGLTNTIPASSKITTVKSAVASISASIKALSPVAAVVSGMTKLETTKTKIEEVITKFDEKTTAITGAYDTLLAATDGQIDTAFTPFLTAIDGALTFMTGDGATIATALSDITYTGISDELTDAFTRVAAGLTDLKAKTEAVKTAIQAAFNSGSSATVSDDALRQHVTLKVMYNLLNSATKVRTYLPLVKYILQTTIENLAIADAYVKAIKDALDGDVSTVVGKFTTEIEKITTKIEDDLAADFDTEYQFTTGISNAVSGMTGILAAPKANDLKAKVTMLNDLFGTTHLATGTTTMKNAFDHISSALTSLITTLKNSVTVTDNALINLLINTLMGNDEYGRYCYYKYKDLVQGLFDLSFDAGWMCIDKEYARLEHLRTTLLLIIDLLAADYEDVQTQIGVCNSLGMAGNSNTNDCVAALETFYTDLFAATSDKIDYVFKLASDEAVASENRLLICFQLVNLDTSVTQVAAITEGLTICSQDGPNGSD